MTTMSWLDLHHSAMVGKKRICIATRCLRCETVFTGKGWQLFSIEWMATPRETLFGYACDGCITLRRLAQD